MRLRLFLPLLALCLFGAGTASAWDFSVSYSGNEVIVNFFGMDNRTSRQTCYGASMDEPGGGASCGIPGSSFGTDTLYCNRVGPHTLFVHVYDSTTNGAYETRSIAINVPQPPPVTCPAYSVYPRTSRALTHKYGSEDWPFGQNQDSQIEVAVKPILIDAGTNIYLKVIDEKDPSTSTYRTQAPATDDNIDSGAGRLAASPSDSGTKNFTYSVTSDPLQKLYLTTTAFASGDNYVIEYSADPALLSDPNFVCDAAHACGKTFPITAWKRVYLEKHEMFRNGAFVAAYAAAGQNQVLVEVPRGRSWSNISLRAGDTIRLLHAPRMDGLDFYTAFYYEDKVIGSVDAGGARNRRLITFTANLQHSYDSDASYPDALRDGIADGAADAGSGLYQRNEDYLNNSFASMFVEFFPLDQVIKELPFSPVVRRETHFANKWFENSTVNLLTRARPGRSNVKHVLAVSGLPEDPNARRVNVTPYTFGDTGVDLTITPPVGDWIPQPNFSYTFVGSIERAVGMHGNPYRGLDPWVFNGENLVHELAHTFNVNSILYYGTDFGHCSRTMAGNPALNCKMRSSQDPLHVPAQSGDGTLGFHYLDENDSEYMTIRRAMEPIAVPVH
ncbi:MAG TPA: hypothetical protein VM733_01385 [Thermoanaerobaculia bacterium]|nr:hypothetical protein [Thermoanaerobaculia bacterium]